MNKQGLLALAASVSVLAACSLAPKYKYVEPIPTLRLTLVPHDQLVAGKPVDVDAKLNDLKSLYALQDKDLETAHTQKIHLLIIDPSLSDYQHVHPEDTKTPGVYHFQFTPKNTGNYRVWADVMPVSNHKQEFVSADLGTRKTATIDKTESHEVNVGGYHFSLNFDKPPVEGDATMGSVEITDAKGNKVTALQPLMGAYGHIVGFYDDYRTIVHIHPMGDEPKNDSDRGGPELSFHLMPVKAGFVKLFAQVKIGNKEYYAPFGVNVKPAN